MRRRIGQVDPKARMKHLFWEETPRRARRTDPALELGRD